MFDYGTFVAQISLCAVAIFYLVRGARDVFPEQLAPEPATKRSKGLTFLLSLALGAGLGQLGLAPNFTEELYGAALTGLIVGALVYGGAKIPGTEKMRLEDKGRLGKKRRITREEAKAAGLNTGQYEALNREPEPVNPPVE